MTYYYTVQWIILFLLLTLFCSIVVMVVNCLFGIFSRLVTGISAIILILCVLAITSPVITSSIKVANTTEIKFLEQTDFSQIPLKGIREISMNAKVIFKDGLLVEVVPAQSKNSIKK